MGKVLGMFGKSCLKSWKKLFGNFVKVVGKLGKCSANTWENVVGKVGVKVAKSWLGTWENV